jgi:hypothetical protein
MATGVPADEPGWIEHYRGLRLDLVLRLARLEGRAVRVVGPDEDASAAAVPDRLTVRVDSEGALAEVRAG